MDRISELRIAGLRTIESVTIPLEGMTVLIGENGSGKSSIVEACRILSRIPNERLEGDVNGAHGGVALLRTTASELRLGIRLVGETRLDYEIVFRRVEPGVLVVVEERLEELRPSGTVRLIIDRTPGRIFVPLQTVAAPEGIVMPLRELAPHQHNPQGSLLARGEWLGYPAVQRLRDVLSAIEVHVPFHVDARWAASVAGQPAGTRDPEQLQTPPDYLELYARNLKNVFFKLRNASSEEWTTTLHHVRLGLGDHIEDITTPSVGGGSIAMDMNLTGSRKLSISSLSDGELTYLAFVALARLQTSRSLLAFDEPDVHLHPGLLLRVVQLMEALAVRHPVLLTTHSDALLDCLTDPAAAVLVCELELPMRRMVLRRLDRESLQDWLKDYRGVGHLRSEGFLSHALHHE